VLLILKKFGPFRRNINNFMLNILQFLRRRKSKDPQMWACVVRYGTSHNVLQKDLENLKPKFRSPEKVLIMLLKRGAQKKYYSH